MRWNPRHAERTFRARSGSLPRIGMIVTDICRGAAAQRNRQNQGRSQPPPSLRGSPKLFRWLAGELSLDPHSTTVTGMRWRWSGRVERKAWPELLQDAADSG